MSIVISVENLSKSYQLGVIGTGTFYGDLKRWWAKQRGKPDPYLKIGDTDHGNRQGETMWALKDVNFSVQQGEALGIIGRNGAGKSTLLKILSQVTAPTSGVVKVKGRIASLLEVGTGFHPELTGRENIYLNGAIMGMSRTEVTRKFDEIVDFSGVEKYIDTPVKRYSSGMYVRLAFAVAAHLDPDILIVDEVLAVGDAEFQKKCLGKMGAVAEEGRTVLFVSHNMAAIRNLCERTLLIDFGRIIVDGPTQETVARYLDRNLQEGAVATQTDFDGKLEGVILRDRPTIRFMEIALIDEQGLPRNEFQSDEVIRVSVTYECQTKVHDLRMIVIVVDEENRPILTTMNSDDTDVKRFYHQEPGVYKSSCIIPPNTFGEMRFYVSVHLQYPKVEHLVLNKILGFDVNFQGYNNLQDGNWSESLLRPQLSWEMQRIGRKDLRID